MFRLNYYYYYYYYIPRYSTWKPACCWISTTDCCRSVCLVLAFIVHVSLIMHPCAALSPLRGLLSRRESSRGSLSYIAINSPSYGGSGCSFCRQELPRVFTRDGINSLVNTWISAFHLPEYPGYPLCKPHSYRSCRRLSHYSPSDI